MDKYKMLFLNIKYLKGRVTLCFGIKIYDTSNTEDKNGTTLLNASYPSHEVAGCELSAVRDK